MTQLSFIVACYNEEPHLRKNLERVVAVLETSAYNYEIILIDDVSRDRTVAIAEDFLKSYQGRGQVSIVKHQINQGRGRTVQDAIMLAKGNIAGFVDIDLSTSPWYILPLAAEIENGADVVLGARMYKLKWKVLHRWVLSKGYKWLVRLLLNTDLGDTETGCKFFNRDKIMPILSTIKDQRWFWDTEVIVRARLAGLSIKELPTVFVRESLYSRVRIFHDSWNHFVNLVRLSKEVRKSFYKD